jgi:Ca-activated chloride channel homolog
LEHHADAVAAAARVMALRAGGSTNLSGGWLKGLEMLATSPRADVLRRVIVLTDGHANAGVTESDRLVEMITGGQVQGVTTSCIGFDAGYDEQLLAALADAGAGNDYWCDGADQAARVFADEFGGLANVVAQNVSVEVRPTDVVASCGVLNEFPITEMPGGVQVALGDAYGGEQRKVVAKFHLRPQPEGPVHVADLVVRWVATGGAFALHTVTVPVAVTSGTGEGCIDATVHEEVLRLEVAKTRREARDAAERGDLSQASLRFMAAATMAEGLHGEESTVRELRLDAQRTDLGDWTATDAKRHYSRSRSVGRGRKSDYTAEPDRPDA